jgi:hypothetical protein
VSLEKFSAACQDKFAARREPQLRVLKRNQLLIWSLTALAQATARSAEAAASAPEPLEVSTTAQLRDLAASAARVFGWDNATPQVTHNQLVITADQLRRIRMLRESVETEPVETLEEVEERIKRLSTSEGQEELRRIGTELLERAQNMEQPKLPATPSGPETYSVKISS